MIGKKLRAGERPTVSSVARALGVGRHKIYRVLREGSAELRWGRGRPKQHFKATVEQESWMTSRQTLRLQVGMNLAGRALAANKEFGTQLRAADVREIYSRLKVTMQKLVNQHKPMKNFSIHSQELLLREFKERFRRYR